MSRPDDSNHDQNRQTTLYDCLGLKVVWPEILPVKTPSSTNRIPSDGRMTNTNFGVISSDLVSLVRLSREKNLQIEVNKLEHGSSPECIVSNVNIFAGTLSWVPNQFNKVIKCWKVPWYSAVFQRQSSDFQPEETHADLSCHLWSVIPWYMKPLTSWLYLQLQ